MSVSGKGSDRDAHFGYVCSDLSMNRGAFDAGNYALTILSAPPSDDEVQADGPDEDTQVV